MKKTTKKIIGAVFFGTKITTSVEKLAEINVYPTYTYNTGTYKVNFEFVLETDNGEPFIIYDWKYYRPIKEGEIIEFNIGGFSKESTERAKKELIDEFNKKGYYLFEI